MYEVAIFTRAISQTGMAGEEMSPLCLPRPHRIQMLLRLNTSYGCLCGFSVSLICQMVEIALQGRHQILSMFFMASTFLETEKYALLFAGVNYFLIASFIFNSGFKALHLVAKKKKKKSNLHNVVKCLSCSVRTSLKCISFCDDGNCIPQ